ncbi:MAG: ABC transporter permease [Nostocoides sp.]
MSAVEETTQTVASARHTDPPKPRTLSTRLLRSEMRLVTGRRRNQMGMLVLAALPVVLAIAVKVTSPRGRGNNDAGDFLSQATANGLFVPLAALTLEMGLFLPMAIAMLSGDSIAGEANLGTLRYLLTVPVNRTRLLAVKYASLVIGAFIGVTIVTVVGAVVGIALFGTGPMLTLSGVQIGFGTAVGRLALAALYCTAGIAALGAVGLFVSTLTEQPIAATVTVMIVTIVSWIILGVDQLAFLHPWLIVDQWMSFSDLFREPPLWSNLLKGLGQDLAYAAVFWLAAWARFTSKDITS